MQQLPSLVLTGSSTQSLAMRDLQGKIADLYRQLSELDPKSESKAQELISAIRLLETELIGMGKAQPGYCLRAD